MALKMYVDGAYGVHRGSGKLSGADVIIHATGMLPTMSRSFDHSCGSRVLILSSLEALEVVFALSKRDGGYIDCAERARGGRSGEWLMACYALPSTAAAGDVALF